MDLIEGLKCGFFHILIEGNYYELTHKNAFMGSEMYRLELIDTTKYKVKGFNPQNNTNKYKQNQGEE